MSNRFVPPRTTGADAEPANTVILEFGARDNAVFLGLASAMKFVGVMFCVFGVLQIIGGLYAGHLNGILTAAQGLVMAITGGWLTSAASSLRAIATTQGNDVGYLMVAMTKLRSVYTLQAWLIGLACLFVTISIWYKMTH